MMKMILTAIFGLFLFGCDSSYKNKTEDFQLPEELKDCKVYALRGENYSNWMYVVACPNKQTTTYQDNKKPTTTIIQ